MVPLTGITTKILMEGKTFKLVANFESSHSKYFIEGITSFWEAKTSTESYRSYFVSRGHSCDTHRSHEYQHLQILKH